MSRNDEMAARCLNENRRAIESCAPRHVDRNDLFQTVAVRVLGRCDKLTFNDSRSVRGLLLKIARDEVVSMSRRASRMRHLPEDFAGSLPSSIPEPATILIDAERRRETEAELASALQSVRALPPSEREIVASVFWDKKSVRDIAKSINVNPNTLRSRIQRCRKRLRRPPPASS